MFRFAHPAYISLLLLIPVLIGMFIYTNILKHKGIKRLGNPHLLMELMPRVSFARQTVKFYMQLVVVVLLIITVARPQFGTKTENVKRKGIEVIIAMDVSNSMMAQDIQPSRLDKAKLILSQLIDGMSNDKVGLIVFAGDAYVQLPITVDYVSAKMFLSSISPQLAPRQGTAIGSAIDLSIKSFGKKNNAGRAIIVITDGENHEDDAISATKLAVKEGIAVHVIGMGTPDGAPIPMQGTISFWKDKEGNVVVSKLNEEMCKNISQAGRGVYVRSDNSDIALKIIDKELDKLSKADITTTVFSDYTDQFQSFAILAFILLLINFFVPEQKSLGRWKIFDLKTIKKTSKN